MEISWSGSDASQNELCISLAPQLSVSRSLLSSETLLPRFTSSNRAPVRPHLLPKHFVSAASWQTPNKKMLSDNKDVDFGDKQKILFNLLTSDEDGDYSGHKFAMSLSMPIVRQLGYMGGYFMKTSRMPGSVSTIGSSSESSSPELNGTSTNKSGGSLSRDDSSPEQSKQQEVVAHDVDLELIRRMEVTRNKLKVLTTTDQNDGSVPSTDDDYETKLQTEHSFLQEKPPILNPPGGQFKSLPTKRRSVAEGIQPLHHSSEELYVMKKRKKLPLHLIESIYIDNLNAQNSEDTPQEGVRRYSLPSRGSSILKRLLTGSLSTPDKDKVLLDLQSSSQSSATPTKEANPVQLTSEIVAQVLTYLNRSVQFALNLPEFARLSPEDQKSLLVASSPRLILLYMASESFHLKTVAKETEDGGGVTIRLVDSLNSFISRCCAHHFTQSEYFYLRLIALFKFTESEKRIENSELVSRLYQECLEDLRDVVADRQRYTKILLSVYTLFGFDLQRMGDLFMQPLLANIKNLSKDAQGVLADPCLTSE